MGCRSPRTESTLRTWSSKTFGRGWGTFAGGSRPRRSRYGALCGPSSAMRPRSRPRRSCTATSARRISYGGTDASSSWISTSALGDPAFDLGNLFAQLFRMSIKKPKNIPDLAIALTTVLDAYRRSSRPDPELEARVAWYERATLLRKIHGLIFSKNRSQEPEAVQQRHTEAVQLLRLA